MSCLNPTDWLSCGEQLVGKAASSAASDAFSQIAHDFASTADHVTTWLWSEMNQATAVELGGKGWGAYLGITLALAATVGAGLFLIQVIASALRRDMGGLGRGLRGLLITYVAGAVAVSVAEILVGAADAISNGVMQVGLGTTNWTTVGNRLAMLSTTSYGSATLLLVALFMIASTILVWLALTIRKLLLIITAVFAPVAFAGSLSDVTASWVRKWIEYTAALIFSKVILVIIFVVGLGVLDNGLGQVGNGATQQATQLMTGLLILCLAGLAPWMAIKVVHFAGDSFHAIHAHGAAAAAAANTAVMAPQKVRQLGAPFGVPAKSGGRSWQPGSANGQDPTGSGQGRNGLAHNGSGGPGTKGSGTNGADMPAAATASAAAEAGRKARDGTVKHTTDASEATAPTATTRSSGARSPGPGTPQRWAVPPSQQPSSPPPPVPPPAPNPPKAG
jgi:type IV secretion system protein TrbL